MNTHNNKIFITLTPENASDYGCSCLLNPKHYGHLLKLNWLKRRLKEGLRVKLLILENENKPAGFIEYIPGEFAWRAVDAKGYMFIHCMWLHLKKYRNKGYGSLLLSECVKDAKNLGYNGVAVVTSEGAFMVDKGVFLKNGFELVEKSDRFELLVLKLTNGVLPKFKNWKKQLNKYSGLNIVYSNQCPWVGRSIISLGNIAKANKLNLKVTELKTPEEAQNAPSVYSVFNLIYNGRLLADHYISDTRFKNIIDKEIIV